MYQGRRKVQDCLSIEMGDGDIWQFPEDYPSDQFYNQSKFTMQFINKSSLLLNPFTLVRALPRYVRACRSMPVLIKSPLAIVGAAYTFSLCNRTTRMHENFQQQHIQMQEFLEQVQNDFYEALKNLKSVYLSFEDRLRSDLSEQDKQEFEQAFISRSQDVENIIEMIKEAKDIKDGNIEKLEKYRNHGQNFNKQEIKQIQQVLSSNQDKAESLLKLYQQFLKKAQLLVDLVNNEKYIDIKQAEDE